MKINTGIAVPIERDGAEAGEFRFDPSDIALAERFYDLMEYFRARQDEYEKRLRALDAEQMLDEHGIPSNARARLSLAREACLDVHKKIDEVFGAGVSDMAFGGTLSFDAIEQFFDGLMPYLDEASQARIRKYTNREQRRTLRK